jgi:hypothetical protein
MKNYEQMIDEEYRRADSGPGCLVILIAFILAGAIVFGLIGWAMFLKLFI